LRQAGKGDVASIFGQSGVREQTKGLVKLGGSKIQPFLQAVPFHRSSLRGEAKLGLLIRNILNNRRTFGQNLTIVEFEGRYIALSIDVCECTPVCQLFLFKSTLSKLNGEAGLAQRNVGRQRTGTGRIK
jgi:hypothetical protein